MKIEELENIFELIINDDKQNLLLYCKDIELISKEENDFDIIYNNLANIIEEDSDLLIYFKEYAKVNEEIRVIIPYFQKTENIKYFIDNFDNVSLGEQITNTIEDRIKNNPNNNKEEIEKRNAKLSLHFKKYGLFYLLILELIALIITIDAYLPFIQTHIIKTSEITEATIIDQQRNISFTNYFTTKTNIKYSYIVNDISYTNEQQTFLVGADTMNLNNQNSKIKIYYNIKKPNKSKIYNRYGKIIKVLILIGNVLFIIGIIEFSKLRKKDF